jgi:site-specific recombinase XerD
MASTPWTTRVEAIVFRAAVHVGGHRLLPILRDRRRAGRLRPPPELPPESPTLGLAHLQFEAILSAGRLDERNELRLVALLGLFGLRIFEATNSDITDLGEEHRHRVLCVRGKGDQVGFVPLPPSAWTTAPR